ncbi:MAG: hypothetical protein AAF063_21700 [Cyanobacteria bacterium J06643_5]
MEPLTSTAIATLVFNKAIEKTTEKFTEAGLEKLNNLRLKIVEKFRGNKKAEAAIAGAEKGLKPDLQKIASYLEVEMDSDERFAKEVKTLAREINQEIKIDEIKGRNMQNVYGGEAYQSNDSNAPTFQGVENSPININYHQPPS